MHTLLEIPLTLPRLFNGHSGFISSCTLADMSMSYHLFCLYMCCLGNSIEHIILAHYKVTGEGVDTEGLATWRVSISKLGGWPHLTINVRKLVTWSDDVFQTSNVLKNTCVPHSIVCLFIGLIAVVSLCDAYKSRSVIEYVLASLCVGIMLPIPGFPLPSM